MKNASFRHPHDEFTLVIYFWDIHWLINLMWVNVYARGLYLKLRKMWKKRNELRQKESIEHSAQNYYYYSTVEWNIVVSCRQNHFRFSTYTIHLIPSELGKKWGILIYMWINSQVWGHFLMMSNILEGVGQGLRQRVVRTPFWRLNFVW